MVTRKAKLKIRTATILRPPLYRSKTNQLLGQACHLLSLRMDCNYRCFLRRPKSSVAAATHRATKPATRHSATRPSANHPRAFNTTSGMSLHFLLVLVSHMLGVSEEVSEHIDENAEAHKYNTVPHQKVHGRLPPHFC